MSTLSDEKAYADNYKRLKRICEKKGYIFNPNQDWVDQVVRLMTNNQKEHGKYFCPCKQHYPIDIKSDVVCPCSSLDEEVTADGCCHCRLFCSKDFKKKKFDILETITCPG
jgi:ferredoxin-thioredoxin reductase catalytic subunit